MHTLQVTRVVCRRRGRVIYTILTPFTSRIAKGIKQTQSLTMNSSFLRHDDLTGHEKEVNLVRESFTTIPTFYLLCLAPHRHICQKSLTDFDICKTHFYDSLFLLPVLSHCSKDEDIFLVWCK